MKKSEEKEDIWGNKYTQHYDSDGHKSGTSEEKEDIWSNKYEQHRDSDYKKAGTSEKKEDIWGNEYTQHYDSDGHKSGTSEEKEDIWGNNYTKHTNDDTGGCYLTTACVIHKGLPDDCEELMILRKFRDNYIAKMPNGNNLINEYYHIAPTVVSQINRDFERESVWERVYSIIKDIVNLIKKNEYEKAVKLYITLSRNLLIKYSKK